jgi:hypothetical protein
MIAFTNTNEDPVKILREREKYQSVSDFTGWRDKRIFLPKPDDKKMSYRIPAGKETIATQTKKRINLC